MKKVVVTVALFAVLGTLAVCGEEDFETFYEMTNITSAQIDSISAWGMRLHNFQVGDASVSTPCIPCNASLGQYGDNVDAIRAVINELKLLNDPDTVPCFTPSNIDSCIILCHATQGGANSEAAAWCLLNCSLSKVFDRMSIHLAAVKADE